MANGGRRTTKECVAIENNCLCLALKSLQNDKYNAVASVVEIFQVSSINIDSLPERGSRAKIQMRTANNER